MNQKRLQLKLGAAALVIALPLGTLGAVQISHQRQDQTVAAQQPYQANTSANLAQPTNTNAEGVLNRMYATYAAMHSFKCYVRSHEEPLSGDQVATYEIERPNKIRFSRATLIMQPELSGSALAVSDGSSLHVTCTENKGMADRYAKLSVSPGWFESFGGLTGWGSEPYIGMPDVVLGIRLKPDSRMDDPTYSLGKPTVIDFSGIAFPVPLDVVVARMPYKQGVPGRDWLGAAETVTYYIGQKDHLLYQLVVTDTIGPASVDTRTETYNSIEVNPSLPTSDFVFTPPPGSHEVSNVSDLFPGGKM